MDLHLIWHLSCLYRSCKLHRCLFDNESFLYIFGIYVDIVIEWIIVFKWEFDIEVHHSISGIPSVLMIDTKLRIMFKRLPNSCMTWKVFIAEIVYLVNPLGCSREYTIIEWAESSRESVTPSASHCMWHWSSNATHWSSQNGIGGHIHNREGMAIMPKVEQHIGCSRQASWHTRL